MMFSLNSSVKRGVGGRSHVRYKKGDSVIISLYSSLFRSTLAASSASGGGSFLQNNITIHLWLVNPMNFESNLYELNNIKPNLY